MSLLGYRYTVYYLYIHRTCTQVYILHSAHTHTHTHLDCYSTAGVCAGSTRTYVYFTPLQASTPARGACIYLGGRSSAGGAS